MEKFIIESNGRVLKLTICRSAHVNRNFVKILYRILENEQRTLLVQFQPGIRIEPEAGDFILRFEKRRGAKQISVITELLKENLVVEYNKEKMKALVPNEFIRYEEAALRCMRPEIRVENYYLLN